MDKSAIGEPERTLEVVAPSDLQGGYEFFVDAGNHVTYKVRVPPGGVVSGQRFQAVIVSEASTSQGSHNIPTGHWRDGLCDCCNSGCCHPQFCLTFWCRCCALGQVLTRMKLNWFGEPRRDSSQGASAFKILFALTIAYWIFRFVLTIVISASGESTTTDDAYAYSGNSTTYPSWAQGLRTFLSIVVVLVALFLFFVTCRARNFIRSKYSVPEQSCNGCEDCCCSFWCNWCTICQMARHTADYRTYPAGCCTENGLNPDAPEVV